MVPLWPNDLLVYIQFCLQHAQVAATTTYHVVRLPSAVAMIARSSTAVVAATVVVVLAVVVILGKTLSDLCLF